MIYTLKNECLSIQVNSMGGEVVSMRSPDGLEYLWQPNPAYWKKQAPHLFPVVGRLTNGEYSLDGQRYKTDTHGFFRWKEMELVQSEEDRIILSMKSDAETCEQYPRRWEVKLEYRLSGSTLSIGFAVTNQDEKPMYFGYGGHPGFRVPLEDSLTFEDYALQFEPDTSPVQVGFSEACFVQGPNLPLAITPEGQLPLTHSLFDNDAVVLKQAGQSVRLCSTKSGYSVTVAFSQMPYLGIWHSPKTDAGFVCIEPWTSLPSRQDIVEALEEKADMICLPCEKQWRIDWSITCG